jgi:hypothetical protein
LGYSRKSIELYINNVNGESEKPDVFTAYLGPYGDLESYIKIDWFGIIKKWQVSLCRLSGLRLRIRGD